MTEIPKPTPAVYRKFVEDSEGYPIELVDGIEGLAQSIAQDVSKMAMFGIIAFIARQECLSMELEQSGEIGEAIDARKSAMDVRRVVTEKGTLETQEMYRDIERKAASLLLEAREKLPNPYFKTAPSVLGHVGKLADIITTPQA